MHCKGTTFPLRSTNDLEEIFQISTIYFFSESVDTKICCGVAVLQFSKGYFHTLKILLYLYINIELIFDFHRIYFGTATLQQVQQREQNGACTSLK